MRSIVLYMALGAGTVQAQVSLDTDVQMTGNASQRVVYGLGDPMTVSSALHAEAIILGSVIWADAEMDGDTLVLTLDPGQNEPDEGLFLRFLIPVDLSGEVQIRLAQGTTWPVLLPDGTPPFTGQMMEGKVAEVLFAMDHFVLLHPPRTNCPMVALPITPRTCIAIADIPGMNFWQAGEFCIRSGGRLCTWDEWVAACMLLQNELVDTFGNWEWIDDTSDHTQTADQVGSVNCQSQQSTTPWFAQGATRCCFDVK